MTAHVRGGQLAITLPTMCGLPDRDWELLGRVRMRSDWPEVLKLNYIARHRDTGELARGYVIRPTRPDVIDPHTPGPDGPPGYAEWKESFDRGQAVWLYDLYAPIWDEVSRLPEIDDVFLGTSKDFEEDAYCRRLGVEQAEEASEDVSRPAWVDMIQVSVQRDPSRVRVVEARPGGFRVVLDLEGANMSREDAERSAEFWRWQIAQGS